MRSSSDSLQRPVLSQWLFRFRKRKNGEKLSVGYFPLARSSEASWPSRGVVGSVELVEDLTRRLAVRSHIEEQSDELLILRETLRMANANERKRRPLRAKDADGNSAALH